MSPTAAKIVTARKPRTCYLCCKPIEAGHRYVYQRVAPWETYPDPADHYWTYAAHPVCHLVWCLMDDSEGDLSYYAYGELAREYAVIYGSLPTEEEALARLREQWGLAPATKAAHTCL